jgi:pyruvate dehydrogenase E1 component beta subunit
VKDTPISEAAIIGAAVGAAMNGLRPVPEIMTVNFAFVAFDAIVNSMAKIHYMFNGQFKVPMVLRWASGWGMATATALPHPRGDLCAFPRHVCCHALHPAGCVWHVESRRAVMIIPYIFAQYHRLVSADRSNSGRQPRLHLPIGKSDVKREGHHVTLVAYARGVHWALDAAKELAKEGIECEVIDFAGCVRLI